MLQQFSQENFRLYGQFWRKCPFSAISTHLSTISFRIRRLYARSRIGAIIRHLVLSRRTELVVIVFASCTLLAFWGSSGEGQASLLHSWIVDTVEETAVAFDAPTHISSMQLADLNSVSGATAMDGTVLSPAPSMNPSTVQESAFLAVTPPDSSYLDQLASQRSQITQYTVQEGDRLSFIASDFGVSIETLIWANNLKSADAIAPGQVLRVPPITGVIHRAVAGESIAGIAKKYGADEARIIAYNRLPKDGSIQSGIEMIIPDGRMPAPAVVTVPRNSRISADTTPRAPLYGTASLKQMLNAAKLFTHLPDLGSYFAMPTTGFDWGLIHGRNGVDIANSCGTVVKGAASGTVTVADVTGWNGGFGKYIKISHPNGTETLYAHLSKILVTAGENVAQGEKIALMGTTGQSTGCHLHFEVHGARNPLAKD